MRVLQRYGILPCASTVVRYLTTAIDRCFPNVATMSYPTNCDRSFGPRVDALCRSFDFTMQFEDIFLACLPTALFLVLSPFRIILLLQKPAAFSLRSKLLASKLVRSIPYQTSVLLKAELILSLGCADGSAHRAAGIPRSPSSKPVV